VNFEFSFKVLRSGMVHGIGSWFEAHFLGSQQLVVLSTAPSAPATHWYQMRFLLPKPIPVTAGQLVTGILTMKANQEQSYDVRITVSNPELKVTLGLSSAGLLVV
jgi:hypothetical protein